MTSLGDSAAVADVPPEQLEFFESRIRPVLAEHCYACHNSIDTAEGGLSLDHRAAVLKGGDNGSVVTAGQPGKSRLLATIRHEIDGFEMPDGGAKLGDDIIADFEKWIRLGLPDPRDEAPSAEELSEATSWENILASRKKWWSFQPIADPTPPAIDGIANPIDQFIAATWRENDLRPTGPADAQTLVRRLYFNLIGLPPSPEEAGKWVDAIESGNRDEQLEKLVDQLLASPQFGERWARHWMDWIRYAESHGSEGDPGIENAWLYRDYLIRALNADVPYDQLLSEHVAGDLLDTPRIDESLGINESLIGTAHWRMVFHGFAPTDALDERVRFTDDQIDTFSKAFLGLTVSCARCHDHKFDAISQADYYALFGIFASCRPGRSAIETEEKLNAHRADLAAVKQQIPSALLADWKPKLRDRLAEAIAGAKIPDGAIDVTLPLGPFLEVRRAIETGKSFEEAWRPLHDQLTQRTETDSSRTIKHWRLDEPTDAAEWTATGIGLSRNELTSDPARARHDSSEATLRTSTPVSPMSAAGTFAVAAEGDRLLTGIYPEGVYSHTLSAKDPARFTSPDIQLGEPLDLWVRAIGDKNAALRYVVQDYPRNGTVYPTKKLESKWKWHRFDLSYWTGDDIHIELTTAKDAPLLTAGDPRSWFGVTDAILCKPGRSKPTARQQWSELFVASNDQQPQSLEDLIDIAANTVSAALDAWANGTASNSQAELLGHLLGTPVLPNTLDQLPGAAPLAKRYREVESRLAVPTRVPTMEEAGGTDQALFVRGNHKHPSDAIPRRFLEAIDDSPYATQLSGRLELADDLIAADNPFTRRVIVNRIWHHLFGEGLVSTPDNFGRLGMKPTHPGLLDYLATRFGEQRWSIKSLIKAIVLTRTWQLSSTASAKAIRLDPDNRLLARANVRRLEAEVIRDSFLAVSGVLTKELYGPPTGSNAPRRSVYVRVIRNNLDPFLRTFDFPEPSKATGRRSVTNVPAQALALMNDNQVARYAASLANRAIAGEANDVNRIRQLVALAFSRSPVPKEVNRLQAYLNATRNRIEVNKSERDRLSSEIESLSNQLIAIEQPIRDRLEALQEAPAEPPDKSENFSPPDSPASAGANPNPIAAWDFTQSLGDTLGSHSASLQQKAVQSEVGLRLGGNGYAITAAIDKTIREKTLEAWVRLGNLDQRGGGVMTIQSLDGVTFDSIVFGEMTPREWLAGSNNHRRSKRVNGPVESQAINEPVHLAITYASDGSITCYRNGVRYGQSYKTGTPIEFAAGHANIAFGLRHLPAGGNRLLDGTIIRARLYDRALSADEVESSYAAAGRIITQKHILAAMKEAERQRYGSLTARRDQLQTRLDSIPEPTGPNPEWTELARAVLLFKEFIYIR